MNGKIVGRFIENMNNQCVTLMNMYSWAGKGSIHGGDDSLLA